MTLQNALYIGNTSQVLTALLFGYTSWTPPRYTGALIVLVLTWLFHQEIQGSLECRIHIALLSACMWIQCVKTFVDLCLVQTTPGTTVSNPFFFGLGHLWNMRGVGTSTQITKIPPWSTQNPSFVPSRRQEVQRHVKTMILSYLVLDIFSLPPPPDMEMLSPQNEALFGRLADITPEEAIFRFFLTIGFWLNNFCLINLINSTLCLVYIGLGLCSVRQLPPIWGSLSDAYSVRRFWGNTWHQTLRRPLTSVSEFIVHGILGLSKGSLLARYSKLMICFYISGALHYPADISLGVSSKESNAIAFFVMTALVIMLEDGVQHVFRLMGRGGRWARYFGYAWVYCYMYWLTPSWGYPSARVIGSNDRLISFSVIRMVIDLVR